MGDTCSQCGQATPTCAEEDCGETIIFVPKSGFGQTGEWRHVAPPKVTSRPHMARPVQRDAPKIHVWNANGQKVSG